MKKFYILFALIIVLNLSGCSLKKANVEHQITDIQQNSNNIEETTSQTQPTSSPTDNIKNTVNIIKNIDENKIELPLEGTIPKEVLYLEKENIVIEDGGNNPLKLTLKINDKVKIYENKWNDGLYIGVVDFDTSDNTIDILITAAGTDIVCNSTIYQYDGIELKNYASLTHVGSQLLYDGKGNIYFSSTEDMSIVDKQYSYILKNTEDIKDVELIKKLSLVSQNKSDQIIEDEKERVGDLDSLIPEGWHILEKNNGKLAKVEGDLNNDSIDDLAVVIEENIVSEAEMESQAPSRSLLIAFGNSDNTYSLSIKADNAILLSNEGGIFGDPFEDIVIERGSILLKFYGGSNWRWYYNYRFRFQNEGWYMIGATLGSYFTGNTLIEDADEEDYNLITGDFIIKKTNEEGKQITTKGNRGKRELVNLKDFVPGVDANGF